MVTIKKYLRKILYLFIYNFRVRPGLSKAQNAKVLGFNLRIYPTVFSPSLYVSSKIFAKFILSMDELKGKEILDMGCGSGIIGIAASLVGADSLSVDINPEAVKCANENFKLNGINANAIESDLYKNIEQEKKFDVIFFNPPYYNYEPRNDFERAFGGGKNFKVLHEFFGQSEFHLKKGGNICIIISSDIDVNLVFSMFQQYGFNYNILQKTDKFFETFYIIKGFLKEQ